MKILGFHLIVVVFLICCFGKAYADYLIEPKLGIEIANEDKSRSGRIDNESSRLLYGYAWGARVGYVFTSLQLGFEIAETDLIGEEDSKDASDTGEVKIYEQGFFIAYQMETLRFWGTKITYAFIDDRSEFIGTGYKIGVGIDIFERYDANIEYASRKFTRETVGSILTIEDSIRSLIISVSFPFTF